MFKVTELLKSGLQDSKDYTKKPFLLFSSLIGGKKGELKKKIQREKQISINIYPISWKEAFFTLLGIKELVGRLYLPWYSF